MLKITLLLLGGCVYLELLKFVTSEQINAGDNEVQNVENKDEHKNNVSTDIVFAKHLPRQINYPAPSPNQQPTYFIECYVCSDCPRVLPNTTSKICPFSLDISKQGCVTYAEKYRHMKNKWYIRGCASERGSCSDIRKAHAGHTDIVSLVSCSECKGDRCNRNGASHSIADVTIAFVAMIVTPLVAKYTFS